jgi:hypothetical protein
MFSEGYGARQAIRGIVIVEVGGQLRLGKLEIIHHYGWPI